MTDNHPILRRKNRNIFLIPAIAACLFQIPKNNLSGTFRPSLEGNITCSIGKGDLSYLKTW